MAKKKIMQLKEKKITHINGTKKDSKAMATAKKQEFVNVEWQPKPKHVTISFETNTTAKDYKFFTSDLRKTKRARRV
jgi:hypothetical protein